MNFRPLFVDLKLDHYYPDKKKPGKNSCRKWYFPFPQFSPWSADWAWKRHKIGHLAGPGESLRRLSTTCPKLNPFHLLKLLINVSSVFEWSSILPQTCNIWKQCHILSSNPHSKKKRRYFTIIRCFLIHVSWAGGDRKMGVIGRPLWSANKRLLLWTKEQQFTALFKRLRQRASAFHLQPVTFPQVPGG